MKIKLALLSVLAAVLVSAAAQNSAPVPIAFSWDDPGPPYTNLAYRLHYTTNANQVLTNWAVLPLTNVVKVGTRLTSTNSFPYDNWFFAVSWTNSMWHLESPFSSAVVSDRLPPTNQQFNLGLSGTP